jgi:hypothetical protein
MLGIVFGQSSARGLMGKSKQVERGAPAFSTGQSVNDRSIDNFETRNLVHKNARHDSTLPHGTATGTISPFRTFPPDEHKIRRLSVASTERKVLPSLRFSPESPRTMGLR